MKHLLSESVRWTTLSEFVDPHGNRSEGKGETDILVHRTGITNTSWVQLGRKKINNIYSITVKSDRQYLFTSENPALGTQQGQFNIDGNVLYSRFIIQNTLVNGYEVIIRHEDECTAYGSLYDDDDLINTWKATMLKQHEAE